MEKRELTKQDIDKVRGIEGFPIGSDEDIIALSDAPYYTACPNPFIEEFIDEYGSTYDEETDNYHRHPFSDDVEENKHDLIYNIHGYHTKVIRKPSNIYSALHKSRRLSIRWLLWVWNDRSSGTTMHRCLHWNRSKKCNYNRSFDICIVYLS